MAWGAEGVAILSSAVYERREVSSAAIGPTDGATQYFAGGFFGGEVPLMRRLVRLTPHPSPWPWGTCWNHTLGASGAARLTPILRNHTVDPYCRTKLQNHTVEPCCRAPRL